MVEVTHTVPDVAEGDKVRGLKAIAITLTVSEKTVKKLARVSRGDKRLPVYEDHRGFWAVAVELAAWMKARQRVYGEPDRAA